MKKVIIIGGGMAGLSAGIYLQKNGFATEIFEMYARPGGLCTAWQRKDYKIDGCIHWLVGVNPKSSLYKIWNDLIDIKTLPTVTYDEFCTLEDEQGIIHYYGDIGKLEAEMLRIAPEDEAEIRELTAAMRKMAAKYGAIVQPVTFADKIKFIFKIMPLMSMFKKYSITLGEYAKRFKSERLRNFLGTVFWSGSPVIVFLMNTSWFNARDAGYPEGGADEVVRRLVAKYESLGGRLQVNAKVKKVLIENGAAKGIELENGEKHYSNIVVSAADGRSTVMNMLGEDKLDDRMKKLYHNPANEPKSSTIYVSLGVNRTFTETAKPYVMFKVAKPKTIDGREVKYIGVTIHNFDPKCAPAGKTVLTVLLSSFDPKYWIKLRSSDLNRYMAEKQAIADWVVEEVDRHFGNIKSSLEVLDVATPATYVRFTGNWNGAIMGWTEWKFMSTRKPKKTIAGIDNFYMCGQWTGDAGLPGAAQGGREVARMICQQEGKKFS